MDLLPWSKSKEDDSKALENQNQKKEEKTKRI